MKNLPHSYLILFIGLIAFSISACQKDSEEVETTEKRVKMNVSSEPKTANPFYYSSSTEKLLTNLQFQTLLTINNQNDGIVPILAADIPEKIVYNDSVILKYTLREDAQWSNGSSVTTNDVLTTFKIIFNPHSDLSGLESYFDFITDIRGSGSKQFTVVCRANTPDVLFQSGDMEIVPAYQFDKENILAQYSFSDLITYDPEKELDTVLFNHGNSMQKLTLLNPNNEIFGSGPYMIKSASESNTITLEKKESWWGDRYKESSWYFEAFPEVVDLNIFTDPMPASLAYSNGELDILSGANEQILNDLTANAELMEKSRIEKHLLQGFVYLAANRRFPLLEDADTRKAIAFLANPIGFVENVLNGTGTPITGPISPQNKQLYNDDLIPLEYNIDSAVFYLEKAGWSQEDGNWFRNGDKLELPILVQSGNRYSEDYGVFLKDAASKAGIEIQITPMEFAAFIKKVRSGDFALARLGMSSGSLNYDFRPLFHSESIEGGRNYPGFNDPLADALIDSLETVEDQEIVKNISQQLQEIIYSDFSYIFLYAPVSKTLVRDHVKSIRFEPGGSTPLPGSVKIGNDE